MKFEVAVECVHHILRGDPEFTGARVELLNEGWERCKERCGNREMSLIAGQLDLESGRGFLGLGIEIDGVEQPISMIRVFTFKDRQLLQGGTSISKRVGESEENFPEGHESREGGW
jgi:hypothetical protein